MEIVEIDNETFRGINLPTQHSAVLIIQGAKGFLSCGYLQIETANKLREVMAVVTRVRSYEDMMEAPVVKVSESAEAIGIEAGMKGRDALKIIGGV